VGGTPPPSLSPVELRVLHMLRERVPGLAWDPRRTVLCVRDFQPHVDVEEVAQACADWLMSGQATRVKDGPATLRAFLTKAKKNRPQGARVPPELTVYNRMQDAS
jgi:hypothetical protein